MKYDLKIIEKELSTLPKYDKQLYLQGNKTVYRILAK